MRTTTLLKQLASLTEQLEESENEIAELTPQSSDLVTEDGLKVDMAVSVPFFSNIDQTDGIDLSTTDATVNDDGSVSVGLTVEIANSSVSDEIASKDAEIGTGIAADGVTDGGTTAISEQESSSKAADPEATEKSEEQSIPQATTASEDSTEAIEGDVVESEQPAYKAPERLAEVYDPDSTFAEMTDELDVDVTPQTVRNYMVEYGIHNPNTETTDAAGNDDDEPFLAEAEGESLDAGETAVEIAEAVELPDDLSLSEVTDAVCTAKTLYEVQNELGVERDQARRILSELNLLELVHGRLSTTSAQAKSKEEVEKRIQQAVINSATSG